MGNKYYNNNILEAVTQGLVGGEPARSLDPFRLAKTTIFSALIILNNSFAEDPVIKELHLGFDKFNEVSPIKIAYTKERPETALEAEARLNKEHQDMSDVELNKAEVKQGKYWVNGKWCYNK